MKFKLKLINDVFTMDEIILKLYNLFFIGLYFGAFALFFNDCLNLLHYFKWFLHFIDTISLLFFILSQLVFYLLNIIFIVVLLSHIFNHCNAFVIKKQVYFLHSFFYRQLIQFYLTSFLLFWRHETFNIIWKIIVKFVIDFTTALSK